MDHKELNETMRIIRKLMLMLRPYLCYADWGKWNDVIELTETVVFEEEEE